MYPGGRGSHGDREESARFSENSFASSTPSEREERLGAAKWNKTRDLAGNARQGGLKKAGGAKVFGAGGLAHFNTKGSDSGPVDRTRSIDQDQSYQSSEGYCHVTTPAPQQGAKSFGAQSNAVPLRKASSTDLSQTPSWVSEGPRYLSNSIESENLEEIDLDDMWRVPAYITEGSDHIFHPTAAMDRTELNNDVLDWDGVKEDDMTEEEWKEKDVMQRIGLHFVYHALPKIASYFLPSELRCRGLMTDFNNGIRFHAILTKLASACNLSVPTLPHSTEKAAKTADKKRENNFSIFKSCFDRYGPNLENGDFKQVALILVDFLRTFFLQTPQFDGKRGIQALHHFMKSMLDVDWGVTLVVCEDGKTRGNLAWDERYMGQADVLRGIVTICFPHILDKLPEPDSRFEEYAEAVEIARIIEIEMGIPNILFLDHQNLEPHHLYGSHINQFLMYCYAAFCLIAKNAGTHGHGQVTVRCPRVHVNHVLRQYMKMDKDGQELVELSAGYQGDLQKWLGILKQYEIQIGDDAVENEEILNNVRSLISTWSSRRIEKFCKISLLTSRVHSLGKMMKVDTPVFIRPAHSLANLEKVYVSINTVYRRIERKVKDKEAMKSKVFELQKDFQKKNNKVRHWINRWTAAIADPDRERFNPSVLNMRRKLMDKFNKERRFMDEELSKAHRLMDEVVEDGAAAQDGKCEVEDTYNVLFDDFKNLKEEAKKVEKRLSKYEFEARELDGLMFEEAALLQNIDLQLSEFYQFFVSRPALNSKRSLSTMVGYIEEAWRKLYGVAAEIDAVYSIKEIFEKMKKKAFRKEPLPHNFYTSHTLEGILVHYENTLRRAQGMEGWLEKQRRILDQLETECGGQLDTTLKELADMLQSDVKSVWNAIDGIGGDGRSINLQLLGRISVKVERLTARINTCMIDKTPEIFSLARPMHERGMVTPRVIDLLDCWDHCLLTLQILQDDLAQQQRLVKSKNLSLEETFQRGALLSRLNDYYKNVGTGMAIPRDQIVLSEKGKVMILPPGKDARQDEDHADKAPANLLQFSDRMDPYGRVTCCMWLDMIYQNSGRMYPTLSLKQRHLEHTFNMLCDGKPFITEKAFKEIFGDNLRLFDFAKNHCSEFFGWEAQQFTEHGEKCYDYKRLVCKLLGLHRRLSIRPE